jgi:predicted MFS family arabinose efflux permease
MLPLVGDLAPPNRRATALSIVVSGFGLGILIARTLSGTITNFTSWRTVYWLSCGLQYTIFILLYLFMPDYPSKNPGGLNYFKLLWSHLPIFARNPVLAQACLISFFNSATFTSFWTTLTFLLAGAPYHFSPLIIGLFGLIGIGGMLLNPVYARFVTDRFVPLFSVIVGCLCALTGITIGTYTGTFTVAGPIIQALLNDFGMMTAQIANRNSIYSIEPHARNRVNVLFMLSTFCGQLTGTAVGNYLYARGGWHRSGGASVGFICASIFFCLIRGPYETGWVGWRGGYSIRKKDKSSADGTTAEKNMFYEKGNVVEVSDTEAQPSTTDKVLQELSAEEQGTISFVDKKLDTDSENIDLDISHTPPRV